MKKAELMERASAAHAAFVAALEGWDEERASRVGVTPRWSVKDVLAHVSSWYAEGASALAKLRAGEPMPDFSDEAIEGFNAAAVEARRGRTYAELRAEFEEGHRAVAAALAELPDDGGGASREFGLAEILTVAHPTHHAAQIEKWKKKLGAG